MAERHGSSASPKDAVYETDAEAAVPLLQAPAAGASEAPDAQRSGARATFWRALFAMCKVVIGAGMMAIPRASYLLGAVLGTATLVGVACLTYWTKAVLVDGSAVTGCSSYASLARVTCGRGAALAVQLAVWAFCFGFMVIYLVVIGDILAGSAGQCNGLLCELFSIQPDRRLVIAAVALLVCAPALANRSVEALSLFNVLGVLAVALLGAAVAGLAVAAVGQGRGCAVPLWPQWGAFGKGRFEVAMGVASVVPVVLSCYVGHQNLHSIMPLLKPYTPAHMKRIVAWAMGVAAALFLLLAVAGSIAFGEDLEVNLLSNMYTEGMAPLVGQHAAEALNLIVRGGYLVCLLGSFLLFMFPLRTTLAEVLARDGSGSSNSSRDAANGLPGSIDGADHVPGVQNVAASERTAADAAGDSLSCAASADSAVDKLVAQRFHALTYGLLLLIVAAAAFVPNIWAALTLVGDVASTVEGFIVPALITLVLAGWRISRQRGGSTAPGFRGGGSRALGGRWSCDSVLALLVLLLGVALFVNGILQHMVIVKR